MAHKKQYCKLNKSNLRMYLHLKSYNWSAHQNVFAIRTFKFVTVAIELEGQGFESKVEFFVVSSRLRTNHFHYFGLF